MQPLQSGTHSHLAFATLPLPILFVAFLKLTAASRLSVPPSDSPKCLRFGNWLTLCTIVLIYLLTYLLTYLLEGCITGWRWTNLFCVPQMRRSSPVCRYSGPRVQNSWKFLTSDRNRIVADAMTARFHRQTRRLLRGKHTATNLAINNYKVMKVKVQVG